MEKNELKKLEEKELNDTKDFVKEVLCSLFGIMVDVSKNRIYVSPDIAERKKFLEEFKKIIPNQNFEELGKVFDFYDIRYRYFLDAENCVSHFIDYCLDIQGKLDSKKYLRENPGFVKSAITYLTNLDNCLDLKIEFPESFKDDEEIRNILIKDLDL